MVKARLLNVNPAVKCRISLAGLGTISKALQLYCTVGTMMRSKHGT